MDHPFGGYRGPPGGCTVRAMSALLEISLLAAAAAFFALLDRYSAACERV